MKGFRTPNRNKSNMNTRALLASIVAELRAIPVRLSGDDSDLADPWEEIKSQVQEELSFYWPAYLDTMKQFIDGAVAKLGPTELLALSSELKVPTEQKSKISRVLLIRLLAKARREKVRYGPFDFEYMHYSLQGISIYAQIIERTGMNTCQVLAYSAAAPFGERGETDLAVIDNITDIHFMTAGDFEKARRLNWPDHWEQGHVIHIINGVSLKPTQETARGSLNAITDFVDHKQWIKGDRYAQILFGSGATLKRKAYELVLAQLPKN